MDSSAPSSIETEQVTLPEHRAGWCPRGSRCTSRGACILNAAQQASLLRHAMPLAMPGGCSATVLLCCLGSAVPLCRAEMRPWMVEVGSGRQVSALDGNFNCVSVLCISHSLIGCRSCPYSASSDASNPRLCKRDIGTCFRHPSDRRRPTSRWQACHRMSFLESPFAHCTQWKSPGAWSRMRMLQGSSIP